MRRITSRFLALLATALAGAAPLVAADDLAAGFASPPDATKPAMYYYWLNNHISAAGVTKDLELMRDLGIGAAFIGHVSDPAALPMGDTPVFSPAWWETVRHAVREGGRLGVQIGMFNCPGWSQSGGPWMTAEQSMRSLASNEVVVHGPAHLSLALAKPAGGLQDVALLAFPVPAADGSVLRPQQVACSADAPDWSALSGAQPPSPLRLPAGAARLAPFTVDLSYPAPVTPQALVLGLTAQGSRFTAAVQVADGAGWRTLRELTVDRRNRSDAMGPLVGAPAVLAFAPTTATAFRVVLRGLDVPGGGEAIASLALSGAARVESAAETQLGAMFPEPTPPWDWYRWPAAPEPVPATTVAPEGVRDLSGQLAADGTVTWDAPAGDWVLSRVCMVSTGVKNGPTAPEATGYECDKLSKAAVAAMFDGMMGEFVRRIPAPERSAWKYVILDSYEKGPQNWTDGMAALFRQRFGYDPLPWLPALAGRVVGSAARTDRFLWDLRRLVADEVGNSYVTGLREVSNRYGFKTWLENYGHWGFPSEFLKYGAHSDEIGGEFWFTGGLGTVETRAGSSCGHIYGKARISAESYTDVAAYDRHPGRLKARGDWSFCQGINHVVLHVYVHQPYEAAPGLTPGFGQAFNRLNPWFVHDGKAWIDYQRRCCFLLQQGVDVADLAYFIGEDAPMMTGPLIPAPPTGHTFDFLNGEVLRERMAVKDGVLTLPHGTTYRLLVLPPGDSMRPETLRTVRDLVVAGAAVLGSPPQRSPSLAGWPGCDAEVRALATELWGDAAGGVGSAPGEHRCGQGRVLWNQDAATALRALDVPADVVVDRPTLLWTHRRTADSDIWFVSNQADETVAVEPGFRLAGAAAGRVPELWDAVSGAHQPAAWYRSDGAHVRVPLVLAPSGSVFVVFRAPPPGAAPAVVAVARDGRPLGATPVPVPDASATGTFTLSGWVRPDADIALPAESATGIAWDGQNHALFAPPAHGTFGGGHAGLGLSVGRNGIVVFAHGAGFYAPVLVWPAPAPLAAWTHVAVVVRDGAPELAVGGVVVRSGAAVAGRVLHADPAHSQPADHGRARFRGQLGRFIVQDAALGAAALAALATAAPPSGGASSADPLPLALWRSDAGVVALVRASGAYALTRGDGTVTALEVPTLPAPLAPAGPWTVRFPPGLGAPAQISLDHAQSLALHADPGVQHFSGTATWSATLEVPPGRLVAGERLELDLGEVHEIAVVRLNGRKLATLWKAPYRVDLGDAVHAGANQLDLEVTNTWDNRLIGDAAFPDDRGAGVPDWVKQGTPRGEPRRIAFATGRLYGKDEPLLPSGLVGPVVVRTVVERFIR